MSNEISRSHWLIMRLSNPSSQRNPRGMNKLRDGAAVSQAGPKLPSNSFTVKRICNLSNPTKRILPIHLLEKNQTTKGFSGGQCLKFTGWFVLALYFFISDDAGDTKKNTKSPWVLDNWQILDRRLRIDTVTLSLLSPMLPLLLLFNSWIASIRGRRCMVNFHQNTPTGKSFPTQRVMVRKIPC